MINVLHVTQPTDAGVARYVADLTAALIQQGARVAVASPSTGNLREWVVPGADHLRWDARRSPGPRLVAETRELARIIDDRRPDVVHLHSSKAGLTGRLALRGRIPTVFQPHAWSFEAVGVPTRWLVAGWERFGARWADRIVCVSETEAERGRGAGIRQPLRVIENGIRIDAWPPTSPAETAAARRGFDMGSAPLAVCIGRLSRQKGQDVLLEAWPRVRSQVPSATLALVGEGPDHADLARRAGPGVVLAGPAAAVRPWLAAADVVVVASRWEGMSLTMLEAMACARCVVATDVPGSREALSTAAIVPVEDPAALAAALSARLLDGDLRQNEAAELRRRAEKKFDFARTSEEVAQLYDEVLAERGQ